MSSTNELRLQCQHESCRAARLLISELPKEDRDSSIKPYYCPIQAFEPRGLDPRDRLIAEIIRKMHEKLVKADGVTQRELISKTIEAIRDTAGIELGVSALLEANRNIASFIDDAAISSAVSLIAEIAERGSGTTVVSIGSGDGSFEMAIETRLTKILNESMVAAIRWILVDPTYKFGSPKFADPSRWTLVEEGIDAFSSIADVVRHAGYKCDPRECVVISFLSLHHVPLAGADIAARYLNGMTFLVVEEPINEVEWEVLDYRIVRTVFELLANMAYQPRWATRFIISPEEFSFEPMSVRELENVGGKFHWLPGTAPPLAIVEHRQPLR